MTSSKTIHGIGAVLALALPLAANAVCDPNITANAPNARYSVSGELVTDNHTGLVWKRCPEGLTGAACATGAAAALSWQDALKRVATVNGDPAGLGLGHGDWRLPNRNELASLVERKCDMPAINGAVFPATPSTSFWTSSPYALNGGFAWRVGFDAGEESPLPKANLMNVRLVRSGF